MTTSKDNTQINSNSTTNSITDKVKELLEVIQELPNKIDEVNDKIIDHRELIKSIDLKIEDLNAKLQFNKIIKSHHDEKLSVYDKSVLRFEKTVLLSEKRRLKVNLKHLEKKGKELLKKQTLRTLTIDLREKVKDPTYYKKYNQGIFNALEKLITNPSESFNQLLPSLVNLIQEDEKLFQKEFKSYLFDKEITLYIRFSGNEEWQTKFFEYTRKLIQSIQ